MSTEVYRVTFAEIARGVNPVEKGYKPLIEVKPGKSDAVLTRVHPDDTKTILVVACDEQNLESRIYSLRPEAIVTRYGEGRSRRILVADEDSDAEFPLKHEITLFPNSIPFYLRAEDEEGNADWLMLRHV